jgi:hypothetical protein
VEDLAAAGAAVDVEAQQEPHPVGGRLGWRIGSHRLYCAEQPAEMVETLASVAIGQQSVVADSDEAIRCAFARIIPRKETCAEW